MVKILIDEKMVQKDDKGIFDKLAQKEVCKMEHDLSEESFQKLKELFKNMNAPRNR